MKCWEADRNALSIISGEELEYFDLGEIVINHTSYTVLTGFEGTDHRCFWCGVELKGKAKRYCRGHMTLYYNHFNWGYASYEARKRADSKCQFCGHSEGRLNSYSSQTNLEVHHIVPLKGETRFFSAYNLPWNLIVLCHDCHKELHSAMRPPKLERGAPDTWEDATKIGQSIMFVGLQSEGVRK